MVEDVWPLFALVVETPRLQLRLPREVEVADLARLAGVGVHGADERPFLTPWAEGSAEERARFVLQQYWSGLGSWTAEDWRLGFGVFHEGTAIGAVTVRARDFVVVREVSTSSWLGLAHQGQGFGTEARAGALRVAFDHLGAEAAVSEVFQDNHASQGVSRKLGYEHDGISWDARGTEVLVSDRLRLTRDTWTAQERGGVTVTGFEACRPMFGL